MQFKPIALITVLLLVIASLLVSGCTTSTTSTTSNTSDNTKLGYMDVKVTSVPSTATTGTQSVSTPKLGYKFVMYNTTVTNINATKRNVHTSYFTLHDSNNYTYSASYASTFPNNVFTLLGDKVNGITFLKYRKTLS